MSVCLALTTGRMISRLRYQQRSLRMPGSATVPQYRFSSAVGVADGASEGQFQEHQIEPAPEFEAHLVQMGRHLEAETLVQPDGDFIVRIDSRNQHVLVHGLRTFDQFEHQRPTDASAST